MHRQRERKRGDTQISSCAQMNPEKVLNAQSQREREREMSVCLIWSSPTSDSGVTDFTFTYSFLSCSMVFLHFQEGRRAPSPEFLAKGALPCVRRKYLLTLKLRYSSFQLHLLSCLRMSGRLKRMVVFHIALLSLFLSLLPAHVESVCVCIMLISSEISIMYYSLMPEELRIQHVEDYEHQCERICNYIL